MFITGSSSNHFSESRDSVGSVQKYFPSFKVIYYDLGLTEDQVAEVCAHVLSQNVTHKVVYCQRGLADGTSDRGTC